MCIYIDTEYWPEHSFKLNFVLIQLSEIDGVEGLRNSEIVKLIDF